jgi:hypothetical protein
MPAVGHTALNVAQEFQYRAAKLEPVVLAYMAYEPRTNCISITTVLDDFDNAAEEQLANIKLHLLDTFQDFAFDFSTIHLHGRDLKQFMPDGQAMVMVERSARQRAVAR